MAEIVISVAAKTAEYAVDPIARQFGYMWGYKSNFQNLEKQVQKLQSRRDIVQHAINEATNNREEIEKHVVNWLDNVKKMIDEAEEIITDNNQANMRCFKRWCPDLKKRYQRSKKAAVKANDVSELEKEGKFDRISYRTNPKETWHPSSKLYEDFESRRFTVDDILNELRHSGVNMVGVHGMGGIGKTTLAREVGKQAEEQKLFDAVVFVEISDKPNTIKIQEAIADKLGLEFRERSESGRAMILCERLKKDSKLLLILDNIWTGLNLETVGIPFGNDHPGCKLLLTTRSIDVLSNDMNSQKNFPIDDLNKKEAWDLFNKVAGACIEQDNLQSLAFDVAKRCGGLPIAIVTIAKALKDKPIHAWRNALRELKRPSSENLVGSVTAQTYKCIWLSYNHLETDELKSTFLLCCTMGFASDASVEVLLRYGMGLRLFKIAYTMEEAWDKVNTLVQKLKESSLLLDHPANGWFSIHDVVRDVGRAIASKDENKITVVDDVFPRELKDKNIMKNCTSLSLYDITELPNEEFDCPTLEFLYIESSSNSSKIPDDFFRGMPNLRVLHLMEMELSPLPTSLGCLVNLRTLCLNYDFLSVIGFTEDMKDLEILVLSCFEFEELPKEVGKLTQLRVLDLSSCFGLEIIPPNTISRLTKLEELYMPYEFNQWQVEGVDSGRSNVSLEELKDLSQLTTLQIRIQDAKIVPKGLFSQKLQRYEIHIGAGANRWNYSGWDKTSRFLALEYDDSIDVENIVVKQLKGIEEFHLIGKQGNSDLVYIVDSSKQSEPCDAFPRLETLSIRDVISLEKICHGELMPNSFCRLRNIKVEHCEKLKNFFSFTIASHLSKLQQIEVTDCENMEEFFTMGRRNDVIVLDQLQFLSLENLPKLRRFCSEADVASSSDQEKRMLDKTSIPFFDGKVEFPNLKTLKLYSVGFETMWHNQLPLMSSTFQNLTDLIIRHCCNMKSIFTSSTGRSFVQLQYLEVSNCEVLEEIIRINDEGNNVELPSLKKFRVKECPEMKAFIFGDKVSFPSLEEIEIHNCMKFEVLIRIDDGGNNVELKSLKKFSIKECPEMKAFNFGDKVSFPSLEEIDIHNCMKFEVLIRINDKGNNVELPSLKKFRVKECPEMKAFIFGDKVSFPSLEEIEIHNCMKFEVLIRIDDGGNNVELKSLKKFSIKDCPEMKAFNFGDKVSFPSLEKIEIHNCMKFEVLIRIDDGGNNVELKSLKKFSIKECPEMKAFNFGDKVSFPSLEEIEIHNCMKFEVLIRIDDGGNNVELLSLRKLSIMDCPEMKTFIFNDKVEVPNLKTLELREINFDKMWHNQLSSMSSSFQNLTDLVISNCCNLKYIFASSTLTSFVQLQLLEIRNCEVLEEIIRIDDLKYNVELLSLKNLSIGGCPEMKAFVFGDKDFCSGNSHNFNFPSLEMFFVFGCFKMNIFSSAVASTPMLRKMELDFIIYDCEGDVNTTIQRHIHENEVNLPVNVLPKTVIRTLNQGSSPMSMDFHPVQQTLLLVGTNVGDIGLWEVGSRERLVLKNFKVWDLSACTMPLQAALVKDPGVSVNRVLWSPDGSLFGVAYSRHIVQIHAYNGGDDVRQHLEIDAHVGGVNDLAFSHPNKQLCVITCGDDKTIKVWDAATGAKQYIFEGHDAPVYSVCPHHMENIQFIFSTALDGKIKSWLYDNLGSRVDYDAPGRWCGRWCTTMAYSADNLGSRVDYDAPGRWCTTMAYSADGTRLLSCGTSKDGESYIVEWNESEGAVKRTYQGFRKRSLGVVQFDTTKNRFLAAGDDFSIKFWEMGNVKLLNSIDADGGLPASPRIRFNKDGSLLAVSANENGIKILANLEDMRLLRNYETLSYDALRTSEASKPAINPISAAATSAGLADRGASVVSITGMNGDARSLGAVKPRMTEESNDKSKIWKLTEINESSQCRSLKLPEILRATKISRLIFTNSGNAILALASNAIHLLWKWQRSDRNSSGKATASVSPQLWQPPSGILMTNDVTDSNPEEAVPCFALSKNNSYLISASGGKISLFNMKTFKTMTTFMPPPPAATFLAFHPQDNNIIAIGMDDSTIQIYNVRVDEVKSKLKGHSKRITGLAFSHVLNVLVSSGAEAQLCVWNSDGWEKQKNRFLQIPAGRTPIAQSDTRVQFHQDQIHFLVVHETQLAIFETTKLDCVKQWVPRESSAPITDATFSCDSQLVYASFLDATVCVYSAVNLRLRCCINPTAYLPANVSGSNVHPLVIAAHPQEPNQLALGLSDGSVHVFEPLESEGKWGVPPPVEDGSASSVPAAPSVGASGSEQAQR